jgi:hypothetical protein
VAQKFAPKHRRDICHPKRHARVARIGFLYRIDTQKTNSIGNWIVTNWHCGSLLKKLMTIIIQFFLFVIRND